MLWKSESKSSETIEKLVNALCTEISALGTTLVRACDLEGEVSPEMAAARSAALDIEAYEFDWFRGKMDSTLDNIEMLRTYINEVSRKLRPFIKGRAKDAQLYAEYFGKTTDTAVKRD